MSFLLDWELTMKCNLDCSYCGIGHDNSTKHPNYVQCLETIDFMFEYVDHYMANRKRSLASVVLNVYGGEALYHPNIVQILEAVRERYLPYQTRWHLTVTTTTNAIVSPRILDQILPLIDEFTVSYHAESTSKQQQQFRQNLLRIQTAGVRQKCVVLMHPQHFDLCTQQIDWLQSNGIAYLPRQLDHSASFTQFNYQPQQIQWFDNLYTSRTQSARVIPLQSDLSQSGRACCGGRSLCENQDYRGRNFFVNNQFPGWSCSVNHFFLYIRQLTGEVFTNKDCRMNFDGEVGPIGNLAQPQHMLEQAKNTQRPTIRCAKSHCWCGLCAPKAHDQHTYKIIMEKYEISNS